jgi:hypothetical protein
MKQDNISKTYKRVEATTGTILAFGSTVCHQWLGIHSSWTPSHYETGSVISVKMP